MRITVIKDNYDDDDQELEYYSYRELRSLCESTYNVTSIKVNKYVEPQHNEADEGESVYYDSEEDELCDEDTDEAATTPQDEDITSASLCESTEDTEDTTQPSDVEFITLEFI